MKNPSIIISVHKNSTKDEIETMREKYSNQYKVHLIISGKEPANICMKNFLLDSLTK